MVNESGLNNTAIKNVNDAYMEKIETEKNTHTTKGDNIYTSLVNAHSTRFTTIDNKVVN